ncbi:hypothetical protein [Malaciobacter marinus]|uniref:hypothetical protein n=1 Tax=Malaciobacter marinus TaxID=505249 RepID=UPI003AFF7A41
MEKDSLYFSWSIFFVIGVVFLAVFIFKVNDSDIGKYKPMGKKMILDTTNGNVYIPKKFGKNGDLKWKKIISFKTKDEIKKEKEILAFEELEKVKNQLRIMNEIDKGIYKK